MNEIAIILGNYVLICLIVAVVMIFLITDIRFTGFEFTLIAGIFLTLYFIYKKNKVKSNE